ncbi:hypothetical protein [Sutterella sp.]|uniref:hypothetical protein n=1 Tax=Sutterella sp. TaxID=1981025 RepID=UPI003FD789E0
MLNPYQRKSVELTEGELSDLINAAVARYAEKHTDVTEAEIQEMIGSAVERSKAKVAARRSADSGASTWS